MGLQISANISDLLNQIKEDEAEKERTKKEWTQVTVEEVWKEYSSKVDSKSTKNSLDIARLKVLPDGVLHITIPNKVNRETIKSELGLVDKFREVFVGTDLRYEFEVNIDAFPEFEVEEKKIELTPIEKLEVLKQKNPLVTKLINTFDLKLSK